MSRGELRGRRATHAADAARLEPNGTMVMEAHHRWVVRTSQLMAFGGQEGGRMGSASQRQAGARLPSRH